MTGDHSSIDHPRLGTFTRATTELPDGSILTHDWFAATADTEGAPLALVIEGSTNEEVAPLLPRLTGVVDTIPALRRIASDAVVTAFSTGDPESHELDEAASDLELEMIEVSSDGTVILHLTDTCGIHFPEGYWPAVHLGEDDSIILVTVES